MTEAKFWVPFSAFISHRTADTTILAAVAHTLQRIGVQPRVAEWRSQAGPPLYDGKIREMMQASDCLVAILTSNASNSPDVNQEIGAFWERSKPIVAFVEEGIRLTGVLTGKEVVYFDTTNIYLKLNGLAESVSRLREQKQDKWVGLGLAGTAAAALGFLFAAGNKKQEVNEEDAFFTISQAAQYCGYSESSIRRWIRDEELPVAEDRYRTRYISKNLLDIFLIDTRRI